MENVVKEMKAINSLRGPYGSTKNLRELKMASTTPWPLINTDSYTAGERTILVNWDKEKILRT